MNKLYKLLMTTTAIVSVFGWNMNTVQAESRQTCRNAPNQSSRKTAYSSGWLAGFNGGTLNNTYENERSRKCYDWGYTDGKIEKSKLDIQKMRNDSFIYQSCLSSRLLDPNIQCRQPNY